MQTTFFLYFFLVKYVIEVFFVQKNKQKELTFTLFKHDIEIGAFYNLLYQANDVILALFFIVGSFLFFKESTTFYGTILFVIGSFQLLIRPLIMISKEIHIYRIKNN
ncbi:YrhK family protein [Tetragenococcus muriaticus]|uniref:YrhK family protein n=1 Tax=Tetragenococcus muriaticus TaxID=64642 RepID=UPI001FCF9B3D|nr:YrhK family protein [Tetragenococcus muriaticus]